MTDAGRQASAVDDTHLIFTGATVTAEAPLVLDAAVTFEVTAPAGIAGEYAYNAAQFGAAPTPANFSGEMAVSTGADRSEEHTSELQSLMRSSYAVLCLKTKNTT